MNVLECREYSREWDRHVHLSTHSCEFSSAIYRVCSEPYGCQKLLSFLLNALFHHFICDYSHTYYIFNKKSNRIIDNLQRFLIFHKTIDRKMQKQNVNYSWILSHLYASIEEYYSYENFAKLIENDYSFKLRIDFSTRIHHRENVVRFILEPYIVYTVYTYQLHSARMIVNAIYGVVVALAKL